MKNYLSSYYWLCKPLFKYKKNLLLILSSLVFSCQSSEPSLEKVKTQPIKILIIDGFSNHDWQATTQALLSILKKDSSFSTEVSTIPPKKDVHWSNWLPEYDSYDLIIQNTNDINNGHSWPEPAKKKFEQYMMNGGAMLVFHSANNAFPNWKEYNKMIGLGWRNKNFGPAITIKNKQIIRIPKGQGMNTGHGKRVDTLITKLGKHPIHQGLPAQWRAADLEIYTYARGPAENIDILSYAKDARFELNFPIEWTVQYGKGRIYNSTYGHYWRQQEALPPSMRCVAFQTIFLRSIKWLAKVDINSPMPKNFPSTTSPSLYTE